MRRPEQAAVDAAVALGRGLRERGLAVCVDQELVLLRALAEVDVRRRRDVYWAARASFVHAPADVPAFDRAFARFWDGESPGEPDPRSEHGETDQRMQGPQHGGESLPQLRHQGRGSTLLDGQPTRATREIPASGSEDDPRGARERRGVLAAWSPDEALAGRDSLGFRRDELGALRRLADDLRTAVPERRSRRLRPSRRRGRLDMRRTLRQAMRTDGEPVRPAYNAPSTAPRRLLLICDVSGSMERYSRALLAALQAAIAAGVRAETFVFATRLTRLTGALHGRDAARALDAARDAVTDWSGGTRIGATLADFNRTHGRRGLARGAIAIVVSDGWDRGDPLELARELERLRLSCRRLVWLNPRPGSLEGQPLAIGMRAALPFVDDYVPGHDPRAVERLARVIGGLGEARPARRQRPLSPSGRAPRPVASG